jgi:hypothetical protein
VAAVLAGAWRDPPPPLALPTEDVDGAGTVLLATGVGGLAWRRLRASDPARWPAAAGDLRDAFRSSALDHAVRAHQLAAVVAVLARAAAPCLVGKGWAVARLYPEPGLRAYGDLDLYVPAHAYAAALEALRVAAPARTPVDVHRGFAELDDLPEPTLFARACRVELAGREVPVFGPEDHLRLVCLHALRHGLSRPGWLCDVALAVESRPRDFDWARLLSGRPRRSEAVADTLALAGELLGANLEGTPLAGRRAPRWLVRAALRQWGGGSGWREPIASSRRRRGLVEELWRHWPNAIEATAGLAGPRDRFPRLPLQLVFAAVRAARFARRAIA